MSRCPLHHHNRRDGYLATCPNSIHPLPLPLRHGHTNVPEWNRLNLSLGRWCMNQRSMARKGLLHNRRRLALQKLGFAFDQPGFGWMCQYLLVLKHVLDQVLARNHPTPITPITQISVNPKLSRFMPATIGERHNLISTFTYQGSLSSILIWGGIPRCWLTFKTYRAGPPRPLSSQGCRRRPRKKQGVFVAVAAARQEQIGRTCLFQSWASRLCRIRSWLPTHVSGFESLTQVQAWQDITRAYAYPETVFSYHLEIRLP
jgi:hypothetical protein